MAAYAFYKINIFENEIPVLSTKDNEKIVKK